MFRISYAIPVWNEHVELDRLLKQLVEFKGSEDEIVVQCDQGNTTQEVFAVLSNYDKDIRVVQFPLKSNFAASKNNLKNSCKGAWIFQIDADEYLNEAFLKHLPTILQQNPTVDLFLLPRINTVEGLTQEHINKWRWNIGSFPEIIKEKVFDLDNPRDLAEYSMLKEHNLVLEEKQFS
jgi:glycosyltransferase involved in cell wall biosynthesis